MTNEEQNVFMSEHYAEAVRYMNNAEETLKRAEKLDHGWYKDVKYVRSACGIAYLGVLVAIDAWLTLKGVEIPKKKKHATIDFYLYRIAQLDKKILDRLDTVYNILHIEGYYRRERNIKTIENGFKIAYEIIEKIKPENPVNVPESKGDRAKRLWDKLLISLAVIFRF
jgi:hypothetical protein